MKRATKQTHKTWDTSSTEQTLSLGRVLGSVLQPGVTIGLVGPLGAGKTRLVKGIAAGNGLADSSQVTSPTFTLIQEYPGIIPFFHADVYRLSGVAEAEQLGLPDLQTGAIVLAIEWADHVRSILPGDTLWIELHHVSPTCRRISMACNAGPAQACIEAVASAVPGDD